MIDWKAVAVGTVTVALSVCGAAFFAGQRDQTIAGYESRIAKLETSSTDQGKAIAELNVVVARLTEQLKFLNENIGRLMGPKR